MPSKKAHSVGLDIGTKSIKIVALEKKKNRWQIKNFLYRRFDFKGEEDPVAYEKWVEETLREAVSGMGLERAWASSPLSGTQVALRKMTFPEMPLEEIREAVRFQGKTVFPFVLDNAVIDVSLVGKSTEKTESRLDVLVAAAIRDQVNQRMDLLSKVNLRPFCLSLVPLALKKIYLLNRDRPEEESVALIDIGAHTSTIAMVQKKEVVFSREIGVGGENLTEALIDLSRTALPSGMLSYQEAEEIKSRHGIPLDDLSGEQTDEGLPLEAIREGLMPIVDRLIMEIDRSFGYFKTQAENQNIDRIFLSGGGALLRGLSAAIERSFNLPVAQYDLWDSLEIDPGVDAEEFTAQFPLFIAPLGLAVEDRPAINLLPYTRKSSPQMLLESGKKALLFGGLPLLFLGFLGYQVLGLRGEMQGLNKKIAQRETELTRMEGPRIELGRLKQQEAELDRQLGVYPDRVMVKAPLREILGEIGRQIPPNMTLTSLTLNSELKKIEAVSTKSPPESAPPPAARTTSGWGGVLMLKGTVFGPGEEVLESLDRFTRSLTGQKAVQFVRLEEVKRNETFKSQAADFLMTVRLQF